MRNFRDYNIWQNGVDLAVRAYQLTRLLPKEELYGLRAQITKAVVSIPANIAEGCSRNTDRDFGRFLEISLGSAFELETHFVIVERIGYIEPETLYPSMSDLQLEQKQINSLITKVKS